MLVRDCHHCREARPAAASTGPAGSIDFSRGFRRAAVEDGRGSRVFPARYGPSACAGECGEDIEVGDPIRMVDGRPVHDECA
jgi:hypothetical protein